MGWRAFLARERGLFSLSASYKHYPPSPPHNGSISIGKTFPLRRGCQTQQPSRYTGVAATTLSFDQYPHATQRSVGGHSDDGPRESSPRISTLSPTEKWFF